MERCINCGRGYDLGLIGPLMGEMTIPAVRMAAGLESDKGGAEFPQQRCSVFTCPYWLGEVVLKSQRHQDQSPDALKEQREIGRQREITSLEARGSIGLDLIKQLSSAGKQAATLEASPPGNPQLTLALDVLLGAARDYCGAAAHSAPAWAQAVRAARGCSLTVFRTATSDCGRLSAIAEQLRIVCDTEGREHRPLARYSTEVVAAARSYLKAAVDLWDTIGGTEFAARLGIALCGAITYIQACAEYVIEIRSGEPGTGPSELKTLHPVRSDKCYRPVFGLVLTGGLSTETWAWCRILFDRMHGRDSYRRCYADIGNMREYRYTNCDDGWDRLYSQFHGAPRDVHWYTCVLGLWYSELKDAVDGAWRRLGATDVQRRLVNMDLWEYVVFCYADCIIQSLLSEDGSLTGHQLLSCFLIKMIDDTLDAEDDVASGELSNGYRTREGSAHATSLRDMTVTYMETVRQEHRRMADIVGLITGWWYVACKQHGTGGWASQDGIGTGGLELNDVIVADIIEGSTTALAWWTERTLRVWRDVDCRAWAPWYTPAGPDVAY